MKNKIKKITGSLLSFVLAASMVTGLSGMTALADEGDPVTENLTETQTIIVDETVDGTADSSFAFHIYQITDAEKPIESEEDIVLSEAGSNLSYLIYDASTDEEIGDGTTGSDGSFTLNAEEYAEFTVLAETDWYVEQDTPEEYPLTDVTAEGDHASVVGSIDGDYVYGVVQYTDETVEPTPTADKPDKTALQEAVEKAQALEESDYTPESWEALQEAIENAEKVLADPDATEEEIEQALKDLEDAEAGLKEAEPEPTPQPEPGVDKSALQEEYNEDAVIQQGDYTPESWETFEEALKKAEDVLNDDDATQEEVDQALEDLRDAKEGLKEREEVDKSALQAEYDDDYTLEEDDYTPETWEPFEEAMEHAKDVLKDEDATQAEVDEALKDLTDAREALERVSEPDPNAPSVTVTSNLTGNSKTYDAESVTLTAEAAGSEGTTLTYQWYRVDPETGERQAIEGATESTYILEGNVSDSGMYICTVTATDADGNEASTSKAITITIAKAAQEISYAETLLSKTTGSAAFTNELTKAVVDPADGSGITYKSSNDSIASVDENGVVTIHAKGTVTITATAAATANYKEASAAYVLVVTEDGTEPEPNPNPEPTEPTVTNVTITAEGLSANHTKTYDSEGVTLTVTADIAPAGADVTYQWYKKNANGEYEAIEGATESTYTLAGDVSDSGSYQCVVTVTNDGVSASAEAEITVTIEPAAQEISYGERTVEKTTNADPFVNELTETVVYPEDGTGITYISSDESVVTVDAVTGEVTIVGTGEATITATAAATDNYAEASASYTVTVREPVAPTVNVIVTSSLIDNAKTYDAEGVSLTAWETSTPQGAELTFQWYKKNANGEYEAIDGAIYSVWNLTGDVSDSGTYKCVVTAQNDGLEASAEAEITITIEPAAQEISYETGVVTKYDHDDDFINPLTETTVYGEITYASSNGDVATVDPETGEVTITGTGYTTITATATEVDNYKEAKASYILFVNTDAVEWEVEVNHEHMDWDGEKGEYVDDLTYTGDPMELEMVITLTEEEKEDLEEVTFQWYRYAPDTSDFEEIEGATEDAYLLEGEDVNAGDYLYMCVAVVSFHSGVSYTIYGPIEVIIEKIDQEISYAEEKVTAVVGDEPFTNPLTETTVSDEEGAGITYASSDETIAKVDENGEVTILADGEVTITATAAGTTNYEEASASYTLTIEKKLTADVTVTSNIAGNSKTYDGAGVNLTATATVEPDEADVSYQWYKKNGDDDYEPIDGATGSVYTTGSGVSASGTYVCVVTATYGSQTETAEDAITVTIEKADQEILFASDSVTLPVGETYTNEITGDSVIVGALTYKSSDPDVASVDEDGKVTIVGVGTAEITVTAAATENYNGTSNSYTITSNDEGLSVIVTSDLDGNEKTYDGKEVTLTAAADSAVKGATFAYQWYKDDGTGNYEKLTGATEATLTLDGNVSDSGSYRCEVTVTYPNGGTDTVSAGITITIEPAAQELSYGDEAVSVVFGDDETYKNETLDTTGADPDAAITYASSDESIAKVDPGTGEVTILAPGTVTITATAGATENYEAASASYTLTIKEKLLLSVTVTATPESKTYDGTGISLIADVTVEPNEADISYQWYKINESGDYEPVEGATYNMYTTDPDVSASGTYKCVVTATYGTQTETAEDSITVTIEKADQEILFANDSVTLPVGETYKNEIMSASVIVGALTYTSSNDAIATVDPETGEVTILAPGTVTITATAAETENYNGASSSYTIEANDEGLSVMVMSDLDGNAKDYDGENVTLTATAFSSVDGTEFAYQWYKDDGTGNYEKLTGVTEATLTLDGDVSDSGSYKCVVTATYPSGETGTADGTVTVTINKAEQKMHYEERSVDKYDYDEPFTNKLIEDLVFGEITYTITVDETTGGDLAVTIDEETGEVTISGGTGVAIVTATAAGSENYEEASASYTLTVNPDEIEVEMKASGDGVAYDETKGAYVLTYTGEELTLSMEITLTADEEANEQEITYQWYAYDTETGKYTLIKGATDAHYILSDEEVDAGSYTYVCVAEVVYQNGYTHTVYGTVEIDIEKAKQEISYETKTVNKNVDDASFINPLTIDKADPADGSGITYTSSDDSIAKVDSETGEVTILGTGTVTITATAAGTANYEPAEASYTLKITEEDSDEYNVKYAVCLYGIQQDRYVDEYGDTEAAGLTFGPATGASYVKGYEAHLDEDAYDPDSGNYCIHWMSWSEIVEQSKLDPSVFQECLENGCTKSVNLTLNDTLLDTSYTGEMDDGDGAGMLLESVKSDYRMWNSSDTNTGGWPASQVRAVLNGKDDQLGSNATYALDEADALISCFPASLRNAIVAKAVKSDTAYNSRIERDNATTYDKLWLFSGKELYADSGSNNDVIRDLEGELYERSVLRGITTSANYADLVSYQENGSNEYWLLRSLYSTNRTVYAVTMAGRGNYVYANDDENGLAPGFCLPGPKLEKPTVEVTLSSDMTDNQKAYDGKEVTLTATVTYTPDIAEVSGQWYKQNEDGDYEALEGETAATLTLPGEISDSGTYKYVATAVNYPFEATDSDEITIRIGYDVKYAVCIWGIEQDTYRKEDGSEGTAGLTFGPATGACYVDTYEAHLTEEEYESGQYGVCLHWMEWDEIIAQSKKDPTVFEDCLENGCTHSVPLLLSKTLRTSTNSTNYEELMADGDGAGYLQESLNVNFLYWTYLTSSSSRQDTTDGYPASMVRTVLVGEDELTNPKQAWTVGKEESLITCFPEDLQNGIVAKAVRCDTVYDSEAEEDVVTLYDKLWLFSVREVYAGATDSYNTMRTNEGVAYQRSALLGTTAGEFNYSLALYDEDKIADPIRYWWLRTISMNYSDRAAHVCCSSGDVYNTASRQPSQTGIAPGFCLPGPDLEEPTADVTVTSNLTNNTKEYDGEEVILTATASVTPDTAQTSYQWYREDESGEFALLNGETGATLTLSGDVSDSGTYKCVVTAANGPLTATAEDAITITITEHEGYDVKYAVSIYGIQQDRYVDEYGDTEAAGLTFGPATGASYVSSYVAHLDEDAYDPDSGNYCIHWMSWDEIIAQSKEDPSVFEDCLENGCTKSVDITLNDTLRAASYDGQMDDGDGAGMLYSSINSNYLMWNSSNTNTGGWPASQVRAVLNGKDDQLGSNATYALDEADALISCFPDELKEAIVAKPVKSDTAYNSRIERDNATTYDKLWLFSTKELYGESDGDNTAIRDLEGTLYERSVLRGITTDNYGDLVSYNESESKEYWLLRSLFATSSTAVYEVNTKGKYNNAAANSSEDGLAPGFCLPGPKVEKPTVEVTVTSDMKDNQKAYDGKEVTLTATVTYTPDTAEVSGQWYKQNDKGDYEPLEGETATTLTLPGEIADSGTYRYVATAVNYPFEATDSDEITIRIGYDVKYAVSVWGIEQDTYRKEDGSEGVVGLTFGPATGTPYVDDYEAHLTEEQYDAGKGYCIHWMDWDEIIAQSEEDPTVFEECLENGCTHSVPILLSDTLRSSSDYAGTMDDGDGASYIRTSVGNVYTYWNFENYNDMITDGGYPGSQIRTVLIGKNDLTSSMNLYPIEEEDCLFSGFPVDLQEGIVAKAVTCDTVYDSYDEENVATVYDKLWLFSMTEVYADNTDNYSHARRVHEGTPYQRAELLETVAGEFNYPLAVYDEDGTNAARRYWWTRTLAASANNRVYDIASSSGDASPSASSTPSINGIVFGFCLPGPDLEEPTADVTVTSNLTNNTKEYDGEEVILTATASVTPDTAQTSYQWYKEDESGEFALLNGETGATLTLSGEVSDSGTYKCVVTATNGPLTATAEDAITITITEHERYDVKYAVCLYAIQQDIYPGEEDEQEIAGLTFGPATGASYVHSYKAHLEESAYDPDSGNYCLHWMTWDEIIAQSEKDPTVFEECLENGCTHSVDITLNDTLLSTSYDGQMDDGDGAGMLYSSLNTNYLMWNSSDTNTGGWPASQVRAVLNGKDDQLGSNATYALDEADALISCFPDALKDAIIAKPVKSDTAYNSRIERDNETTYDKLWLFSTKELYGESDGDNTAIRDLEGELYERSVLLGITTDNYGTLVNYSEGGSSNYWLLRSLYTTRSSVYDVNKSGKYANVTANDSGDGLAPGFCLPGPKVAQPTVDVTVTSDIPGNEKVVDGEEVTLTATTVITPDSATIDSYQWYKKNADGDYEPIEGANADTLTLSGEVTDSGTYKCEVTATNVLFTTTGSGEITISILVDYDVKYAVCIWGIEQDTYLKEDGSEGIAGLTFGPASGDSYVDSYEAHLTEAEYEAGEGYCIHWMTWDEIIAQSEKDPTVFEDCLEHSCTHSVDLRLNDTLLGTSYYQQMDDGDGTGVLEDSIKFSLRNWVDTSSSSSNRYEGGYAASQIRTVLVGADDYTGTGLHIRYPVDQADCLYSCFPEELKSGIVAKAVKTDTDYSDKEDNNITIYDKLWLFSGMEVFVCNSDERSLFRPHEGELYQRSAYFDFQPYNSSDNLNEGLQTYREDGKTANWWMRTLSTAPSALYVNVYGGYFGIANGGQSVDTKGLAPGFCLPGPDMEEPTVNVEVTSTLADNTKEYDGNGVTLTATASVTPDTAQITSYQWYKENESGEYEAIDGATNNTLNLDGDVADSGTYRCVVTAANGPLTATAEDEITITIEPAAQDISYAETEIEKTTEEGAFVNPLTETFVSDEEGGGVTYTSSDPAIASVDAETGEVTIHGAGEVTITATAAATANYKEASASYTLIITNETATVRYAVKIWAINRDTYSYDGGETTYTAGMTFGPATGANYLDGYKAHLTKEEYDAGDGYCIHWMSWDEIIAQDKRDPEVFADCLEYGCTKAVELDLNDTLGNRETIDNYLEQGYDGDGVSTLYYLLNGTGSENTCGAVWNLSYDGYSQSDPADIYSRSRIRTTLTGDRTNMDEWLAEHPDANDYYGEDSLCDENTCLLSCFPESLQSAIVPRTTLNTGNTTSGTYAGMDTKTTYDKLFLYSLKETGIDDSFDDGGGGDYGVITSDSDRIAYEVDGTDAAASSAQSWWTRSRVSQACDDALLITTGGAQSGIYVTTNGGLAPGFCLPEPTGAVEPTVDVTVTSDLKRDRKIYDGEEVTLTAAAQVTPEDAQITSYQWYKENESGGFDPIEGSTGATLTLSGEASDSGTYRCEVTVAYDGQSVTGDGEITITIIDTVVRYAVKIWGINADTYSYDDGETEETAALTFGPALGTDYLDTYMAHLTESAYDAGDGYCIHWMDWDEIIAQSEADPTVFADCLENGCTKAVELVPNETLFNLDTIANADAQGYTGDGVSTLYYLLNGTGSSAYEAGAIWNYSMTGASESDKANIYSRSRIRTTLTGDRSNIDAWMEENPGANDYYGVDTLCGEADCLFSCFPEELQEAIVPRTTVNAGNPSSGTAAHDKTTYDTLWLLTPAETGYSSASDDGGGTDYGVISSDDARKAYEFSSADATAGAACFAWLRARSSLTSNGYDVATYINSKDGRINSDSGKYYVDFAYGLSPCFSIGAAQPEEPTVDVTVTSTLKDNTKEYDGDGVTLTATATVTPDTAQVTSYQWYKQNEAGEFEEITGATYNVLNLDGEVSDSGTYKCVVTAANGSRSADGEGVITITITEPEPYNVKYAVCIWGIQQDTYQATDGSMRFAGLTFGPATGASYVKDYVSKETVEAAGETHDSDYCIHDMSWSEIIAQSKQDPTVFEDCLINGCTKAVNLMLNTTLLGTSYEGKMDDGDGVSVLYDSINSTYRMWNSSANNTGGWPASYIRATLNGADSSTDTTGVAAGALDAEDSLFTCLPEVLQEEIIPKAVMSDTVYNDTSRNNVITYDKLWLFSVKESYGSTYTSASRSNEGVYYDKPTRLNIGSTAATKAPLITYNESGSATGRWTRSMWNSSSGYATMLNTSAVNGGSSPTTTTYGISFGFCLA